MKRIEIEVGKTYRIVGHRGEFRAVERIGDEGWRFYAPSTAKYHAFRTTDVRSKRKARS